MGQHHSRAHNLVHLDVIDAIGLDLYELHTCHGRDVDQIRLHISAQVDDGLDALQLRFGLLSAVKQTQIVTLSDCRDHILDPTALVILRSGAART